LRIADNGDATVLRHWLITVESPSSPQCAKSLAGLSNVGAAAAMFSVVSHRFGRGLQGEPLVGIFTKRDRPSACGRRR
jgi:hypothetical protein